MPNDNWKEPKPDFQEFIDKVNALEAAEIRKPVVFKLKGENNVPKLKDEEEDIIPNNQVIIEEQPNIRFLHGNDKNPGEILDTLGFEFESLGKSQAEVARILTCLPKRLGATFKVYRDGSSEMRNYTIPIEGKKNKVLNISSHTQEGERLFEGENKKLTYGYELISYPMYNKTAELAVWSLLPALKASGDFISPRCATHIHVGMSKNLTMMKNILKMGLWADDLFYAISGFGSIFRGHSNNAIYARPLCNGPYFNYGGNWYQCLNYETALKADSLTEFFAAYGVSVQKDNKYHPARYFGINIYSILLHGTLEFRHFNQTFEPSYVIAAAKLCQIFTEIAMRARPNTLNSLDVCDVFERNRPNFYIDKLHKLLGMASANNCNYNLLPDELDTLENLIYSYKGIGVKDAKVSTHIKETESSAQLIELGRLKRPGTLPEPPGNIDIHNIRYNSIFGE
jgi:hypothetical protein